MSNDEIDALNLDVARALGHVVQECPLGDWMEVLDANTRHLIEATNYATSWADGGPIIERERIEIGFMGAGHGWQAAVNPESQADWQLPWHDGPTPLIAAMRALVESKKAQVSSHT